MLCRPLVLVGIVAGLCLHMGTAHSSKTDQTYQVGVASVDVTPDYPIRLTGYASRKSESTTIAQRIFAKAIAIGTDRQKPAILITVDNCGVPLNVHDDLALRLAKRARIDPARLAICSTHTHSAPWLKGYLPNLFLTPLTAAENEHIERYTRDLTEGLEKVALKALESRRPAKLRHAKGQASFAANRRTKGGPADHDLPTLFITDPNGDLRAIFATYACHCTTLTGEFNEICGDWAGYAQESLQRAYPGTVVLIGLGCAGDANPNPRPGFEFAKRHGESIAASIQELLKSPGLPVAGKLDCRLRRIQLPFDTLPTRAEWENRATQTNYVGSHARLNLARLDRGEKLPTTLTYTVQTWNFGGTLAFVFLPGEVVVDYSLRLKREFDAPRVWVNAYANDVPCYIPSERILREGGYEGGDSMVYYDRPTRFAPGIENLIVEAVHEIVPKGYRTGALREK
jgi:hypothetical protein